MVIFRERWDGNIFFCKNHQQQWFFDGFGVTQPSPLTVFSPQTIAFNGFSMVWGSFNHWFQRCDGFNGSFTSNVLSFCTTLNPVMQTKREIIIKENA